jgi:hypothetical protein
VNWGYFLTWLAYWGATCLGCLGVGLWIGYSMGRDRADADDLKRADP